MKALWQFWEQGITEKVVDEINSLAEQFEQTVGQTGFEKAAEINQEKRRAKIRWIKTDSPQSQSLLNLLHYFFQQANQEIFGANISSITDIQHTLYEAENKGHYDFHMDTFLQTERMVHRKLSMTIQLSDSDDYEGGDFEFDKHYAPNIPDKNLLRKKGAVLIFPSVLGHRVTPVTKGARKSLVTWIDGPLWR